MLLCRFNLKKTKFLIFKSHQIMSSYGGTCPSLCVMHSVCRNTFGYLVLVDWFFFLSLQGKEVILLSWVFFFFGTDKYWPIQSNEETRGERKFPVRVAPGPLNHVFLSILISLRCWMMQGFIFCSGKYGSISVNMCANWQLKPNL